MTASVLDGLDWEDLRILRAVLDRGGFAAAAAELDLVHATVRRRIDYLEYRLGLALFTHSPDGLTPTSAALAMKAALTRVDGGASALWRLLRSGQTSVRGAVSLSIEPPLRGEVFPGLWAQLLERFPALEIESLDPPGAPWEALQSGDADVAVGAAPPADHGLAGEACGVLTVGLFAHARYLARAGAPGELADLAGHVRLDIDELGGAAGWAHCLGPPAGSDHFRLERPSRAMILAGLRAGAGIAAWPTVLAARAPDLVRILPDQAFRQETWIMTRRDLADVERIAAVTRAAADHIRAVLAPGDG